VGTTGGAVVGAIVGAFRRQQPAARHARAAEASGAIVMAVMTRGDAEAEALGEIVRAAGGRDLRLER
jgi:hypothetical protein